MVKSQSTQEQRRNRNKMAYTHASPAANAGNITVEAPEILVTKNKNLNGLITLDSLSKSIKIQRDGSWHYHKTDVIKLCLACLASDNWFGTLGGNSFKLIRQT